MKLTLDLHDIYNRGQDIDRALQAIIDEAGAEDAGADDAGADDAGADELDDEDDELELLQAATASASARASAGAMMIRRATSGNRIARP